MIPRRALFFWGNERMSWLRAQTIVTFCKYHPEWSVHLYEPRDYTLDVGWSTDEQQDTMKYSGGDYSYLLDDLPLKRHRVDFSGAVIHSLGPVQRSDIWRYAQLIEGGVYLDMDIIWVRSIDPLIDMLDEGRIDVAINYEEAWEMFASIAMLMATPNNAFFTYVAKMAQHLVDEHHYQSAGVRMFDALFGDYTLMCERFPDLRFANLPLRMIMPAMWHQVHRLYEVSDQEIPGDIYGVHWFAGAAISQYWNNRIGPNNYRERNSLVSRALRRALSQSGGDDE
jgi:hypothetical protein